MSIRRLMAWALIFSGLLAYVLAFEKPAPRREQPSARGDYEKAFDLAPSDIASLTIIMHGKSVTMRSKNLKWQVTDPPGAEALPEQCESMVSTVAETVLLSVIAEKPLDLKQYGLDAPELAIAVKADGGRQMTLKLGKKSPSEVSLYALDVERRRVVLVGTYISFSAKMFMDNVKGLASR
jgi:hypothetical protein